MLPENLFLEDDTDYGPPPPELPPDNPAYDVAERYAEHLLRKRELMRQVKEIEKELNRLGGHLLNFFDAHPAHNKFSVHGLSLYRQFDRWVRPKEGYTTQDLCNALRESGPEWSIFVRDDFSTSRLTNHIEELEVLHAEELENGTVADIADLLPAAVVAVANLNPTPKIIGRKQPKSKKY
jgi:hypothetical protein